MAKLTKRTIGAERPETVEKFVWDDDLPGFGLRVYPSGRKSYLVQYKIGGRGGRTRRISLGLHGIQTVEEARKKAAKLLAAVADGGDPAVDRAKSRQAFSIADLAKLYLAEGPAEKPNKKASSWATDRSNLERHVMPLLGRKLLSALTQTDIAKFQADVAAGKSRADVRTGPPWSGDRRRRARDCLPLSCRACGDARICRGAKADPDQPSQRRSLTEGTEKRALSLGS